jgi:hypothetical protein
MITCILPLSSPVLLYAFGATNRSNPCFGTGVLTSWDAADRGSLLVRNYASTKTNIGNEGAQSEGISLLRPIGGHVVEISRNSSNIGLRAVLDSCIAAPGSRPLSVGSSDIMIKTDHKRSAMTSPTPRSTLTRHGSFHNAYEHPIPTFRERGHLSLAR